MAEPLTAFTIRRMTDADAEAVAALSGELGYPSDADLVRARLRAISESDLLLVAASATNEPLGFIHATRVQTIEAGPRVLILGLVVSSTARRTGVGRKLIAEVERWAERLGVEAVVVRSNTARDEAHDFYPAVGYEKIKTQAVYLKQLPGP